MKWNFYKLDTLMPHELELFFISVSFYNLNTIEAILYMLEFAVFRYLFNLRFTLVLKKENFNTINNWKSF